MKSIQFIQQFSNAPRDIIKMDGMMLSVGVAPEISLPDSMPAIVNQFHYLWSRKVEIVKFRAIGILAFFPKVRKGRARSLVSSVFARLATRE